MEEKLVAAIEPKGRASSARTRSIPKRGTVSSTARNTAWKSSGIFRPTRPLIVAEAVWQYSHHVLHGLITHHGPILTVANWTGTWPGLVGMLNLNGSLTKAGVKYSTLWSEDFNDDVLSRRHHATGSKRASQARHRRTSAAGQTSRFPMRARKVGEDSARDQLQTRKGDHGRLRRRLHGDVQRHHSRRTAASDRRLQGTAQPVRPLSRDATRSATTKRARSVTGSEQGHEVSHRPERGDRPDRRAGPAAVQDVHRRRAHRRRFRLRRRSASSISRA